MCGFIGFKNGKVKDFIDYIEIGSVILNHRGEDGFGFVALTEDGVIRFKSLEKNLVIDELKKIENIDIKWFIFHFRKASIGTIDLELTHPIFYDDQNISVMQNGTKRSLSIADKSDTFGIWLLTIADKLKPEYLKGAGVVFIQKGNRLMFHKDSTRPLYFREINGNSILFASEPILSGRWYYVKDTELSDITESKFEYSKVVDLDRVKINLCSYCKSIGVLIEEDKCASCIDEISPKIHIQYTQYSTLYNKEQESLNESSSKVKVIQPKKKLKKRKRSVIFVVAKKTKTTLLKLKQMMPRIVYASRV